MNYEILLFDFDETLICSKPAYYAAYQYAINAHCRDDEMEDKLFHDLWMQLIPYQQVFARLGEDRSKAALASFEQHYYNNHHNSLSAYPTIVEMLTQLREAGARLGIVSLKPRRAGEKELDYCGLRAFFEVVIWGDDVAQPKPAPDGCLRALQELKGDGARALICGDSPSDIKMGRAAGIATAAALWGGAHREMLLATAPDYAFEQPAELLAAMLNV
jgi:pyrophosphatase PpaX